MPYYSTDGSSFGKHIYSKTGEGLIIYYFTSVEKINSR